MPHSVSTAPRLAFRIPGDGGGSQRLCCGFWPGLVEDQGIHFPPKSGIAGFVCPQDKLPKPPLPVQPFLPPFFRFRFGTPITQLVWR